MRIAEKAKLNKVSVERALTRLSRLGYLEGTEWPKKTGLRLRALPNDLYSTIEESAFRWNILVSAGIEDENAEIKPGSEIEGGVETDQEVGLE